MSDEMNQGKPQPRVQILEINQSRARVRVEDSEQNISLIPRETGVYDVRGHGGWSRLYVARTSKGIWWVHHNGQVYEFDKSRHAAEDSETSTEASGEIRAPTPAKVAAILVVPGTDVAEGDPVIVLESMKTEQSLTAGVSGKVAHITVAEGQQVSMDELLVVIDPIVTPKGES